MAGAADSISEKEMERAIELGRGGKTQREAAEILTKEFGVKRDVNTLKYICQKKKVDWRTLNREGGIVLISDREIDRAIELGKQGRTKEEAAKVLSAEFGVLRSLSTIQDICGKRGIIWSSLYSVDQRIEYERRIERLKAEYRVLKNKYGKVLREAALGDRIVETLKEIVPALPPNIYKPFKEEKKDKKVIQESLILSLADLHAGEVVKPETTLGFGAYSFQHFLRRIECYADVVSLFCKQIWTNYSYKKVYLFGLGDWVAGLIHEELIETSEGTIMEEVLYCVAVIERFIVDLLNLFPEVELDCITGNHGRFYQKKKFKTAAQDSFDRVCYEMLKIRFKDIPAVTVNISEAPYLIVNVEGWNWLLAHGDNIKGWAGIPFYGVMREIKKLGDLFGISNKAFKYAMFGHFHTPYVLPRPGGGKVFGSGGVSGPTEYSMAVTEYPSPASQWMLGCHREIGVTNQVDVHLQNPLRKTEYRYDVGGKS